MKEKTFENLEFRPYFRYNIELQNELIGKEASDEEIAQATPDRNAWIEFPNGWGVSVLLGKGFYSNGVDTYEVGILYKGDLCNKHPDYCWYGSVIPNLTAERVTEVMLDLQRSEPL